MPGFKARSAETSSLQSRRRHAWADW